MPRNTFLLQGFTTNTHMKALKELLSQTGLERVLLSVAYVTRGGVEKIASDLKKAECRVDAFAGIRNGVTTREGLIALMEAGVDLHYVDTGVENLLFHPKIYICRGQTKAGAIIGSANLTVGGLNNNIESSVVLDLDLAKSEDLDFTESIFNEFDTLVGEYPRHVVRVKHSGDLDALQSQSRLVDETASSLREEVNRTKEKSDDLPRIGLRVQELGHEKRLQKRERPSSSDTDRKVDNLDPFSARDLELLWNSKPLTERDLGVPSGRNTHATGSINLDKGLLEANVDHRHYFREQIFSTLDWKPGSRSTVEEAQARIRLIVKGVDRGEFEVRIGHTTSKTSRAYLQRNAMTRMSWGQMKEFVANRELVGGTMSLYRAKSDWSRFVVKIE